MVASSHGGEHDEACPRHHDRDCWLCALIAACTQKGGPVKVESVEPPQGTTAGGDEISIVGGGFQPGKTQAEVKFGRKKSENVTIASTSKIRVVTPPNERAPSTCGDVRRRATFKIANGFRYVEPSAGESARRAFFGGAKQGGGAKDKIEIEKK